MPQSSTSSFLAAGAIERFLEVEAWQIKEIKQAIKEADASAFISDTEFAKIVEKYAGHPSSIVRR